MKLDLCLSAEARKKGLQRGGKKKGTARWREVRLQIDQSGRAGGEKRRGKKHGHLRRSSFREGKRGNRNCGDLLPFHKVGKGGKGKK